MDRKCLSDTQLRAAADEEAGPLDRQHLESCERCRAGVAAARRDADTLTSLAGRIPVPASLGDEALRRVSATVGSGRAARVVHGATTLRESPVSHRGARVWATAAAVAAVVVLVVFAMPPFDSPRSISAAEILSRSLQSLAPSDGVELREFDLELALPAVAAAYNGAYRIEQLEDYETGRFRAVRYGPDGRVMNAISDDPAAGNRTILLTVDGQSFVFRLAATVPRQLALPALARQHVEAVIRLLQATADETVQQIQQGGVARYVIELPAAGRTNPAGVVQLTRARAVIDAADYQLMELEIAGSYLGEAFSVAMRMRDRQLWSKAEVPSERFDVPDAPGAIVLDGAGAHDIGHDVLAIALKEVARIRQ